MLRHYVGRFYFPTTKSGWQRLVGTLVGDSGSGGTAGVVPAPSAGDAAAGKFLKASGAWAVPTGGTGSPSTPQGRLSLQTGVPVMTSSQTAKTTIYYTADQGRWVPIYDGTTWTMTEFTADLSNDTTASSTGKAGPAAVTTNSNYDLFVWSDSGTLRLTRGPAWSSDTARGTGAGTTELERVGGVYTNKQSITNGPAANRGTYVGTVRSDGSSQINFSLGSSAAGGGASLICVWNMYNRRVVQPAVYDSTASWTLLSGTVRAANNSTGNRISYVCGLAEDFVQAIYACRITTAAAANAGAAIRIGLDSTTTTSSASTYALFLTPSAGNQSGTQMAMYNDALQLGFHFIQALENSDGTNTSTYVAAGAQCLSARIMA